ncbi:MAG: ABC transporter permease [Ignavibacteriaceae bacterium]
MLTIVQIELYKIFRKWRTYIGFIAIAILVPVVQIAMLFEGQHSIDFMTRNLKDSFFFVGNLLNGYFVSYLILNSLAVQIPFLIALVAGDLLAGEATAGTYRILITRPVSRTTLVTGKFIAGIIYTVCLILWLALMSLGLGLIIFGSGELMVISTNTMIIFSKDDILWRFLLAYGYAALSMSVVASVAYLFSSLVENAIGPIVTTMAIIIIFLIISALQIDFFQNIRPFLFTNYILSWRLFFDNPLNTGKIIDSVLFLIGHIIVLFAITLIIFRRKDILS